MQNNKRSILIIGGTGIIGKATIVEAFKEGYSVTTIGIKKDLTLPTQVNQVIADRTQYEQYQNTLAEINKGKIWDVVFDVFNLTGDDAKETYKAFKENTKHIFIVSTTLVYDRSTPLYVPIKTNHPLAQRGMMGGYVDHKLELEQFWQSVKDVNWTILRPYHIVGAGSLLGYLPDHNRDPKLLESIMNDEPLNLCNGGNVILNYIHPTDIARIVLKAVGNPVTFGKAYNAVNPKQILGKDYFEIIGKVLDKQVRINSKPIQEVWDENRGWQLTTLPHVYDTSDLQQDIGFVPAIPLEMAIKEAVENYPKEQDVSKIAVHERMTLLPRPQPIDWLLKEIQ
ncbi:MAG: NAD-dependent epimerase/dehydratase family protein [Candidatus Taylorbacteria bacterium]